jgi:hypothetical protein
MAVAMASAAGPSFDSVVRAQDAGAQTLVFSTRLTDAAAVFERWTRNAADMHGDFTGGPSVASALRDGASFEPHQFQEGMIAWAALAVLREPTFVEAVKAAGGESGGGRDLGAEIRANPMVVMTLPGADAAISMAQSALRQRAKPVSEAGRQVKQAAYDIQAKAWSKAKILEPARRMAEAKTLSISTQAAAPAEVTTLLEAATRLAPDGGAPEAPTMPVIKAVALAALAVLEQAGDSNQVDLTDFTADPFADSCLKMAKLNLYQCLAVAGPHYEDVFCLGQHALIDTGHCVMKASGLSESPMPPPALTTTTAAASPAAEVH